jgi:hypothetical protein
MRIFNTCQLSFISITVKTTVEADLYLLKPSGLLPQEAYRFNNKIIVKVYLYNG